MILSEGIGGMDIQVMQKGSKVDSEIFDPSEDERGSSPVIGDTVLPEETSDSASSSRTDLDPQHQSTPAAIKACCECHRSFSTCGQVDTWRVQKYESHWRCDECLATQREQYFLTRRNKELENRQIIINAYGDQDACPLVPNSLSLKDTVYLLSFVRTLITTGNRDGLQLESVGEYLAPTRNLSLLIIQHLYEDKLISVHPNSPPDALSGEQTARLKYEKVRWHIAGCQSMNELEDLEKELERAIESMARTTEWIATAYELWIMVAVAECLEYFELYLRLHGIKFSPGEMSKSVINNLLLDYSTSAICNFICEAARSTAQYTKKNKKSKKIPKQRACNSIVGTIEYCARKAKSQKVTVLSRKRDYRCPQTVVSKVLFDTLLGIGEDGYNYPPNRERLSGK